MPPLPALLSPGCEIVSSFPAVQFGVARRTAATQTQPDSPPPAKFRVAHHSSHPSPSGGRGGQLVGHSVQTEISRVDRVGFGFGRSSDGEELLIYLALYTLDVPESVLFSGNQEEGSSG